ncbi:cytochrome C oxidase subunit IV family protein [Alkalimarinus coralli]|uniref:cytochrome C oxidase subunit IV family protein n=1 Tax=Alkalimarinus coralli TaxID=2935863 RepID=UPI00202AD216|nr:cytochrome C oxidase subunit IV family protein [Alkalimarinus coralli]
MQLSNRKLTGTWLLLILLTLTSAGLGSLQLPQGLLVFLVLLTVLIKNQQIIDIFMEMKNAPLLWRGLMQCYTLFIVIAVGASLVL